MTKKLDNLLKMKISEIIDKPEILEQLRKELGTTGAPFPMMGIQREDNDDGTVDMLPVLSVIANDDYMLEIYSERTIEEVLALAYCDMPVPSMLETFLEGIERRKPTSTNRTQFVIGDPGHGKSFLGALQGRIRSRGPVEVFDCGGKNMNDLLFEMVLDFGAGDALPVAIAKRLSAGKLQAASIVELLKVDDGIKARVKKIEADFNNPEEAKKYAEQGLSQQEAIAQQLKNQMLEFDKDGNLIGIDWEKMKKADSADVEGIFNILKKVSFIEGLDNAGGNALGMNSQYGALVRAFIEGREIVLDEYNKSREGSDNGLQTVLQFLNGEISYCRIDNPLKNKDGTQGPSYFEFKRDDIALGFFVTMTGNKTEDGVTTRSLNKSVYSRLSPETLVDPIVMDWQHRICQMMMGLPLSTMYRVFKESADQDPKSFTNDLLWLRREKAKLEGTTVPKYQEKLIREWQTTYEATLNLANLFYQWSLMTDANRLADNGFANLIDEVDEEYTKKEAMDFRKIKQFIETALSIRPQMIRKDAPRKFSIKDALNQKKRKEKIEEDPLLNFGTRLVTLIENVVYKKSMGVKKKKLFAELKKAMQQACLRDIVLQDGQRNANKSVEQALNLSAFNDQDVNAQAKMAQKVFCDYLRSMNKGLSKNDDDIIMPERLQKAIKAVNKIDAANKDTLFIPNDNIESAAKQPFIEIQMVDDAENALKGENFDNLKKEDIVTHDEFLTSLALPSVSQRNLSGIWEQNIRRYNDSLDESGDVPQPDQQPIAANDSIDEGMNIAENRSVETGIGLTTVYVRIDSKLYPVHVMVNTVQNKVLVVSEGVSSKLRAAFKEAGITHIDRSADDADTKIEQAIQEMTRGHKPELKDRLAEAFWFRHSARPDDALKDENPEEYKKQMRVYEDLRKMPISELLASKAVKPSFCKLMVKKQPKAA